ncbi:MAG TPA: single-stranded-DNA-specific exonuclease RecJ [Cyclobacteriaceae bacterium]|nr:single-stranded-DNA-specific exonuclease RecJ [Cyclobacteriaceae bacterium]
MQKRWIYKQVPEASAVNSLAQTLNINPYLSGILLQRGINDFETARKFFRPQLEDLHDPFLMKDMDSAVSRIIKAFEQNEKILIYGDYDVDGTTSVALFYQYISNFHTNSDVYVPDRYAEGYGVSETGIRWAKQNNFTLIVALDCGIKSVEMIRLAKQLGIDFIVCDHHTPGDILPEAVAVLDPKREDCEYPYKELSGCGIGYKLLQAIYQHYDKAEADPQAYIDLVAVSIAADIVPITGENRVLTWYGLEKLNNNPLPGLKALIELAGFRREIDINAIVFGLGPRINAAGRVAHASAAVDLLMSKTDEEAETLAAALNVNNDTRREFDLSITQEAISMIEQDTYLKEARSTVLYKKDWHKGVIGIVASRCIEKYYRPTVILTESNNKLTGSARSVRGFDLYKAIESCSDLLEKFGGHKYAAGLTLDISKYEAFRQRFEQVVRENITEEQLTPAIQIDLGLEFDAITPKFFNVLKQMAPFGPENLNPVFVSENVYVVNALSLLKDKHIKFTAAQQDNTNSFTVIGFDMPDHYQKLLDAKKFSIAYSIDENDFNGERSLQLRLKDIKYT